MKFSIRDLLLVTVIVALALGWWVKHSRLQRENWRLLRENDVLNVKYLDEYNRRLAASAEARTRREIHAELVQQIEQMKRDAILHTSQAPAPITPKK